MKAVRLRATGSLDGLTLAEEATPTPDRRDVLIRLHAASLNYRDTIIPKGLYPGPLKHHGIPLSDGAGEVVAVGPEVNRVRAGDRVSVNCQTHWIGGPVLP